MTTRFLGKHLKGSKRLVVVPNDSLAAYERAGYDWLERYYNPGGFFDEVFLVSPKEEGTFQKYGMTVMGCKTKEFKTLLTELEPDVVRAYNGYWASDLVVRNRIADTPVIVSVHNTGRIHESVRFADRVICMSNAVAEEVAAIGTRQEKIRVLPNRVDLGLFQPETNHGRLKLVADLFPPGRHILHVGRKTHQKNPETLIRALTHLPRDYTAIFVGLGEEAAYRNLAVNLGVANRCFWIESITNRDLPVWYSWCDCLCVPSRWEGFGIIFIEAAACGTPIVTSDIAPMNEYLTHGETAHLIGQYENPEALAHAIKTVVQETPYRQKLSANARQLAKRFSHTAVDALEVALYKEAMFLPGQEQAEALSQKLWEAKRGIKKYVSMPIKASAAKPSLSPTAIWAGYDTAREWIEKHSIEGKGIAVNSEKRRIAYPEVTGYFIPSLLNWGDAPRANQYADWLISIQNPDGSWSDPSGKAAYTFDTGQILKGLLALADSRSDMKEPILRGCNWICDQIQASGRLTTPDTRSWKLPKGRMVPEAIHLYCLKPIMEAGMRWDIPKYSEMAHRVLAYYKQDPKLTNFSTLSHFHAYVLEALVDLGEMELARKGLNDALSVQKPNGAIPAYSDCLWDCSTGLFQYALVAYKLGEKETGDTLFNAGLSLQNRSGGFYGSYGMGATYFPQAEISWAIKYMLDALYWKEGRHREKYKRITPPAISELLPFGAVTPPEEAAQKPQRERTLEEILDFVVVP